MFDREHIVMDQRGAVIFGQARRDIIVHFSRSRTMPPKKQVEDAPESGAVLTASGLSTEWISPPASEESVHQVEVVSTFGPVVTPASGAGTVYNWPPAPEELELHEGLVVACPVCKQKTTACGGYFIWDFLLEDWRCTQRVYMHAGSCCTAEPA